MSSSRSFALPLLALASACTEIPEVQIGLRAPGEACGQTSDCVAGSVCQGEVCVEIPKDGIVPGARGASCGGGDLCQVGLCCGNQGVCRPEDPSFEVGRCGHGPGAGCGISADCDVGLVCSGAGLCTTPGRPGTLEVGEGCEVLEDCQRPLICGLGKTCERLPFFPGVSCVESDEELGAFRMYFEVPRSTRPLAEFYRHPFPSDVRRRSDGRLDLSGHPSPGEVGGIDFTARFLGALEQDADGFGLTAPLFVRFAAEVDRRTIAVNTATATVFLVDVDPRSPERLRRVPLQTSYRRAKGQFICQNALGLGPVDGVVLRPKTTYALIVTTGLRSTRGEAPLQDQDFRPMLVNASPSDPELVSAHVAFGPLRAALGDLELEASALAGATVFTTGDPAAIGPKIHRAVQRGEAPAVQAVVRCGGAAKSPCDEPTHDRGCVLPDAATHFELQGKIRLPAFQRGERPFEDPGPDGTNGAFELDGSGELVRQGFEDVCFALSVPKAAMPAGGWPVVIFGHGTGGDYLSGMRELAGRFARIAAQGGDVRVAVLTFDNVAHGPRQGGPPATWADPGPIFFNIANPRGARDNVLQGAADVMSLVRFVRTATLARADTSLSADVRFDRRRVIYYGHSQGTVIAPPALAYETGLRAAVMTGAGGEIGLSVLEKKKPQDVSALVRTAFGDQSVSRLHPAIGLLSFFFGPSDAMAYAPSFAAARPAGLLDLLHVVGLGDGFTPESTQAAWARAAGEPLVGRVLRPFPGVPSVADGQRANVNGASVGVVQYAPAPGGEGHFVGTQVEAAVQAIDRFVGSAAGGAERALIRRGDP